MQTWKLLSFITISLQMKYCCCDRAAPRYRINLDLPPEQRWNEVIDEYRIADRSGLRLGEIIGLNILYDISTFNFPQNLDYEMTPLLRNGTLIAEFTRDDKVIYTAVTFFLYVGVLTGQRPNAFAITLNSRNSGGYIDNILMEIITRFRHPISFSIRKIHIIYVFYIASPSYIDRWTAADIYNLNVQKGRWFLVETNFDHWKIDRDKRRLISSAFDTDESIHRCSSEEETSDVLHHPRPDKAPGRSDSVDRSPKVCWELS
uniref:Acid ceramidase N-terminal domain-containing protein n=1 Tax=Parascaris equorum TaxID=6256 RepID=A0A914RIU8_PAREQ